MISNIYTDSSNTLKSSRFDILCKEISGARYIIEMEKDFSKSDTREGFLKRIQLYLSRVYSSQLRKGAKYSTLKPAVCIVISGSKVLKTTSHITRHSILDEEDFTKSLEDLRWIIIELPKFVMPPMPTELDEWLYLFKEGFKKDDIPPSVKSEIVRGAYEALDRKRWSEQLEAQYLMNDMVLMDYENDLAEAKEEGIAEGKAEGKAEGMAEGKAEGKAEVVMGMLQYQLLDSTILQYANITMDELNAIKQYFKESS